MRVLVIGSGGREHALITALRRSPRLTALHCAPGNAGIAADVPCHPVAVSDFPGLLGLCRQEAIDFVVVGPEQPLVEGVVDYLEGHGIACFGPTKAAARLEGSKGFTKDLCQRHGIPTARYLRTDDPAAAKADIMRRGAPIVIKADGLAAGKGVVIAHTTQEALDAVDMIMGARKFGTAGAEIIIEDYLTGEEVSFFALVDGVHAVALASAQDHKAVGDGDTGPNTGGMGAYCPAPALTPALEQAVMDQIIGPTLRAMAEEGCPFKGILFAGLMLTDEGPSLIEYNARFGDPECEVLMRRLTSDLLEALLAAHGGRLDTIKPTWDPRPALGVVFAAQGYPEAPLKGTVIRNLDAAAGLPDIAVFHAGTARDGEALVATGGRVLVVTALGRTIADAQTKAYQAIDTIDWPGGFCRRDIGWRAVRREETAGTGGRSGSPTG